jgi:hypothetical protein
MSDQLGYLLAFSLTASAMRIFFLWLKRQQLVSSLDCMRPAWSFHGFNCRCTDSKATARLSSLVSLSLEQLQLAAARIVKQQQLVGSLDSLSLEVPQRQLAAKGL